MLIRSGNINDIAEISMVYAEAWKSTYEGLMPEVFVKGMSREAALQIFADSLQPNHFSYFLHVVETGEGRLIGFADGGKERSHPERGVGELYAIYLLKEFQGQGLGRRLLKASMQSLVAAGMDSMVVWVMERSPYRRFYEKCGGRLDPAVKQLDIAGQKVRLASYAWPRLKTIL